MSILYVGFKGKNNASYKLVSLLNGEKLLLTNSVKGLTGDIQGVHTEYSAVYMFGIDKTLTDSVRIESCAEQNGCFLISNLLLEDVAEKLLANGVKSSISNRPTKYLCNDAYYRMLERVNGNTVFIHIPSIKHISDELITGIIKSIEERR